MHKHAVFYLLQQYTEKLFFSNVNMLINLNLIMINLA